VVSPAAPWGPGCRFLELWKPFFLFCRGCIECSSAQTQGGNWTAGRSDIGLILEHLPIPLTSKNRVLRRAASLRALQ
jgi:hypothetical protein